MENSKTIKGKITYKDYNQFLRAALLHKKFSLILYIICLAVILYSSIRIIIYAPDFATIVSKLFPIFILILFYFFIFIALPKRTYNTDKSLQQEMELTFTEKGIHWVSERGTYDYPIEDFRSFIFSKKIIAIYISNRKAIVIPRHFFESKEQEKEIETFIKENYKKK